MRLIGFTGGLVFGLLTCRILPSGADWQAVQPGGTIDLQARNLLELEDGTRVELQSRGPARG
ncbi:DUF3237 family protein [Aquisediminimonas profunda]|uniref:DUF3237 family protein n=1 Tax=Aquisediminimonas profunda TaxID=1550733 RepID=UPI001C63ACB2|nr:DUF3237 family protein [Aquisediminimonas profunda]